MAAKRAKKIAPLLTDRERGDIMLWFGWGAILGYPTDPKSYLREALKPENRKLFFDMPRAKRKDVLRFVIEEHGRRIFKFPWEL